MNKRAIFILGIMVLFFSSAYVTTKLQDKTNENIATQNVIQTKEEEVIKDEVPVQMTASDEVKVTPNTLLILKKNYTDCGHTIISSAEIPEEMVNMTKSELADEYSSWSVEKFTKEEVILSRDCDSFCGEHYLILEEEGKVKVYNLDENGEKTVKEDTDIAFEYLPETDKIILSNGIYVYGTEELNKIREDFES